MNYAVLVMVAAVFACCGAARRSARRYERQDIVLSRMPSLIHIKQEAVPSVRRSRVNVSPTEESCKSYKFSEELKLLKDKIKCKPRPTVVFLESATGSTLIPNAVIVKLCAGSCPSKKRCVSTRQRPTTHHLREIQNNEISCTAVTVNEDVSCVCDCPQQPTECNPAIHNYDKDSCRCVCKNSIDYRKCNNKRRKKREWDDNNCKCVCNETKNCTTGTIWSPEHCKCIPDTPLSP